MSDFENSTLVFVIRIWFESREIKDAPLEWRGAIEHLQSGERLYFVNLEKILSYIGSKLEASKKNPPEPSELDERDS